MLQQLRQSCSETLYYALNRGVGKHQRGILRTSSYSHAFATAHIVCTIRLAHVA